ncbi:MAG: hypothetical protein HN348_31545 [Proteobacteria bacterium]|nr:hypothetical protein [Pseudomonadota bacterium]
MSNLWRVTCLLLLSSCAYKVELLSRPPGASVELPNGQTVNTPTTAKLKWAPFNHQRVVVYAPGYRTLYLDLRKTELRMSHYVTDTLFRAKTLKGESRGEVEFLLIPLHGPAGTWNGDDVR